jgi:hypothetical protein
MVEVASLVVLDSRLFACRINQLGTDDVQGLDSSTEFFRSAVVAQEDPESLRRVIDVASSSHGVEQHVQVLSAASDDDVDCGDIFGLVPFETELGAFGAVEGDASEEDWELSGCCAAVLDIRGTVLLGMNI